MAFRLRIAALARPRYVLRDGGRPLAGLLMAAGSLAFVAGAAILSTSLAPMFVAGGNTALPVRSGDGVTVVSPSAVMPPATPTAPPSASPAAVLPSPADTGNAPAPAGGPVDGVTFELSVPAVGYQAMVRQGVGLNILALGPGHYPGTPWPGQPGNVGVAAHNVYWLSFNRLSAGDRVEIRTQHALYVYEILGSKVVNPNDRTVLAPTNDNRLTLTTCYPLWAGAFATQRLIFNAVEIGGVA